MARYPNLSRSHVSADVRAIRVIPWFASWENRIGCLLVPTERTEANTLTDSSTWARQSLYRFAPATSHSRRNMASYACLFDTGPVLDIGAGRGFFVEALRRRGISCVGVDASPEAAELARRLGIELIVEDAFAYLSGDLQFHGIFVAHVIEHLPIADTERLLILAQGSLVPGGKIVIVTPNFLDPLVCGETFWLDPTHVRPYPSPLVRAMLEDHGFTVERSALGKSIHARMMWPRIALGRIRFGRHFGRSEFYVIGRKPT
jgi:SAM-dependent methyltransferase